MPQIVWHNRLLQPVDTLVELHYQKGYRQALYPSRRLRCQCDLPQLPDMLELDLRRSRRHARVQDREDGID